MHTGERQLKCNKCSAANRHYLAHYDKNSWPYGSCGKTFARMANWEVHLPVHCGERPFRCNLCPGALTLRSSLSRHERKRTGGKPHKCVVCSCKFTQSGHLKNHLRRVHGITRAGASNQGIPEPRVVPQEPLTPCRERALCKAQKQAQDESK
ncbi:hypothetical protein HPB50_022684 [Hyalomma asiaticum]|uniref:Uncharacterized protein n=1 Tax=Hyalomma asiaticum TaxID=266040 RepID=A0ACB7T8F4_HYAAI|nr:hypothetical protein HPB50_022684 [Hyalomma asiaticum]